jgi:DNA adenine methylase
VYDLMQSHPRTEQHYYQLRTSNIRDLTAVERCARFIYLNRFCFNGLYRTNRTGQFNVPRGTKTGEIPSFETFQEFACALQSAALHHLDFEEALASAREDDFVYLDPPYFTSRPTFGEYGYGSFAYSDFTRLVRVLASLDARNVKFLLSYSAPSRALHALDCYPHRIVKTRYTIGAQAANRGDVREWLVANYDAFDVREAT